MPNYISYRKAINQIREKKKEASLNGVYVFPTNVYPDQLDKAIDLLDRQDERGSMRVTYSNDYNFIVRYMPGLPHQVAISSWRKIIRNGLAGLTPTPASDPPGYLEVGTNTFTLGSRKKEADEALCPTTSLPVFPSVVLEVGRSESLGQLRADAKLWIEHEPAVQLVVILSIGPPHPPYPNFPTIKSELWKAFPPRHRPRAGSQARRRVAQKVWFDDWTYAATPMYLLLSDIFRNEVPAAYGNNQRLNIDTASWRWNILTFGYDHV